MLKTLREELEALRRDDRVSFHMPGHKYGQNGLRDNFKSFWDIDITEIPGADNLHDPESILLEAKQRAEKIYGSKESFFLVNGSSCGIMAMIMGTVKRGEKIVISRDAHRSIHHAVSLGGLCPIYLMPKVDALTGIAIGMDEEALEAALADNVDIKAVVCTYPSYSGACVNIEKIRALTAEKGIQLLVDEAHGAHLWLSKALPPSALNFGADVVVQSLHKTMPAMTQTAILHIGTDFAQREAIAHYLTVFQSSSPSYVLLSSIDEAIHIASEVGAEAMEKCLEEVRQLKNDGRTLGFEFWDQSSLKRANIWHFDETKLCLSGHLLGLDGYELDKALYQKGIQSEYAVRSHVLLMASMSSNKEDFNRLRQALKEISQENKLEDKNSLTLMGYYDGFLELSSQLMVSPGDISDWQVSEIALASACDEVSGDWIIPYPPGVPMLCPGEKISEKHVEMIGRYLKWGHKILGVRNDKIRILTVKNCKIDKNRL